MGRTRERKTSLGCCLGLRQWCLCRGVAEVGRRRLRFVRMMDPRLIQPDRMRWNGRRRESRVPRLRLLFGNGAVEFDKDIVMR